MSGHCGSAAWHMAQRVPMTFITLSSTGGCAAEARLTGRTGAASAAAVQPIRSRATGEEAMLIAAAMATQAVATPQVHQRSPPPALRTLKKWRTTPPAITTSPTIIQL